MIALASFNSSPDANNLLLLLVTWLACICGNIYIVGLNQLEDIAIDEINKPHLPLAAGEFSLFQGRIIVATTGMLALLLAGVSGFWLFLTVAVSLAIGTAYSLPPVRLKRFPFLAALCIFTVRGMIVNLGLFLHFSSKLNGVEVLTPGIWVLTLFILIFTVAIAIFKDVPDMEGDKQYNIKTLTLLVGKRTVFDLACGIIVFCYLATIFSGWLLLPELNPWLVSISHLILLSLLRWRSQKVDLENKSAIALFYQFIWKLFFLEYIIFPALYLIK